MNSIKTCSKCGVSKPLDEFNKDKHRKDGRYPQCKECKRKYYLDNKVKISEKAIERYHNNSENVIKQVNEYRKKNKDKIAEQRKTYYQKNKKEISKWGKEYRKINGKQISIHQKEYYQNNKDEIIEKTTEYYYNNKEDILERIKEYYCNNKERIIAYSKEYYYINKEEIRDKSKEYLKTDSGKIAKSKAQAKRKQNLGFIPLNNRFEDCEGHHVDNERVIFIPSEMHRSNPHRQSDSETMIEINRLAFNYLEKECCA